jgi:hypothetical protein
MKHLVVACAIVLLSGIAALAQTTPDAAVLTKMLDDFLAGASKNDPAAHERFWADDLIYTRSSGVRTSKEEILKGLRSAPAPKPDDPVTVYSAEDVVIHQYGGKNEMAIVAFRLVITTTNNEGTKKVANNLNTGVFLKRKAIWQVVAWQSTVVPEPKPETKPTGLVGSATRGPKPEASHSYLKGSRGGCYYLNASGGKIYVDHKFCDK